MHGMNSVTAPMHNSTFGHFLFLSLIRIAVHMVGIFLEDITRSTCSLG